MGLTFTFGGVRSSDYNLIVTDAALSHAPERDVKLVSIPGRSGDLVLDNGRFKTVTVEYSVACGSRADLEAFNAAIMALTGYQRLTDTDHPGEYRMALAPAGINWSMVNPHTGKAKISFLCQPQRWLTSGESYGDTITPPGGVIVNPTPFPSKPLIYVLSSDGPADSVAEITIGDQVFSLTKGSALKWGYYVDTEAFNCYNGASNRNSRFSGVFPVLQPGENQIQLNQYVDSVRIMPRWYKL